MRAICETTQWPFFSRAATVVFMGLSTAGCPFLSRGNSGSSPDLGDAAAKIGRMPPAAAPVLGEFLAAAGSSSAVGSPPTSAAVTGVAVASIGDTDGRRGPLPAARVKESRDPLAIPPLVFDDNPPPPRQDR